jgi:hypothetical protein
MRSERRRSPECATSGEMRRKPPSDGGTDFVRSPQGDPRQYPPRTETRAAASSEVLRATESDRGEAPPVPCGGIAVTIGMHPQKSGSQWTRRWREPDSNSRSHQTAGGGI